MLPRRPAPTVPQRRSVAPVLLRAIVATLTLVVGMLQVPSLTASQALTCADLDSQIWAQVLFETDPTGFSALDPDGNGLACDDLPPGAAPASWTHMLPPDAVPAQFVSVSDGDTIRVTIDGRPETVRLILIDTPETHRPNAPPECFGQEATDFATWLFSRGGQLYLQADVSDRDRYGRLLRYAWLDFGNGEVYLVNEAMVRSGYAALYTYPPDVHYVTQIRDAQRFAHDHDYGLWSRCLTTPDGDTNELLAPGPDSAQPAVPVPPDANLLILRAEGPFAGPEGPIVRVWFVDGTWQDVPLLLGPLPVPQGAAPDLPGPNGPPPLPAVSGSATGGARGAPAGRGEDGCDPSYPDICLPPAPPDLNCQDIPFRYFTVLPPDPHRFDVDGNGLGCEQR